MRIALTHSEQRLLAFMCTALCGAAVAYETPLAAIRLVWLLGGALVAISFGRLPASLTWAGRPVPVLRIAVAAAPALISLYFLLALEGPRPVDKVAWLDPLQRAFETARGSVRLPALHPNVAGGAIAVLVPLQAAALFVHPAVRGPRSVGLHITATRALPLALSATALLATRLRGAWAALAVAGVICLLGRAAVELRRRNCGVWSRPSGALVGVVVLLLAGATWIPSLVATRPDRVLVWSNSWHLAWDYAFTGVGLGSVTMPYSSYSLLVHVPHTTHAHNLFLDIWLEQGLLGLLAFLWIVGATALPRAMDIWRRSNHAPRQRAQWWEAGALTSTLVLLLHGLVDDPYYGYGGAGLLLLLVPLGLLAREARAAPVRYPNRVARRWLLPGVAGGASLAVLIAIPAGRAMFHANLGALDQTRVEHLAYAWPAWRVQDAVRRANPDGLAPAIGHYNAALTLNPDNPTANRRLGQIELSLGDYERARSHLERAHHSAAGHVATRQMLGESLALTGDIRGAARLWQTIPLEQDQLAIRLDWYEAIGDSPAAERVRQAVAETRNRSR